MSDLGLPGALKIPRVNEVGQLLQPVRSAEDGGPNRLSDIALKWMIEEALEVPDGLKIGPVIVDGKRLPQTGMPSRRISASIAS